MTSERIVILGNGGAACHAVQAARQAGFEGEIHIFADVDEAAFNPMLAPYYLKGRLPWQGCFPFGQDFYRSHNVICHLGRPVARLDAFARTVQTDTGAPFAYDHCLVATGANATIPPVPGLQESPFAYPLRTSQSTRQLEAVMASARKVVILGASFVGLKIAEILSHQSAQTLVVDVADQVMPRGAHPQSAAFLQQYYEQHGVDFALGCALQGLEEKESGVCCFFPQTIVEDADFIGVCTGIRSNLDFIDRTQIQIEQGILIDGNSRSSVPDLYAAGDCAQSINPLTGRHEWQGTWANACHQGRAAGWAMAGRPLRFPGNIPQHISPFFNWTYAQVGNLQADGPDVHVETHGNPFKGDGRFSLRVYDGDQLVGVNLINCTDQVGALKRTIALGRPWTAAEAICGHG
jgi:3-phenylpropionate/trans-cinnamate dioxygenase ferredoxin reductase subunit